MNDEDKITAALAAGFLGLVSLAALGVAKLVRDERAIVNEIEHLRAQPSKPRWTDANRWDRD